MLAVSDMIINVTQSYLLEVEFLEHGDADLVVQANFDLKLFHSKFVDS